MKIILALFRIRSKEFYRDTASLSWAILFPVLIIFAISMAFQREDDTLFHLSVAEGITNPLERFPEIAVQRYSDSTAILEALRQYKTDMVITDSQTYWINSESSKGHFLAELLESKTSEATASWEQKSLAERELRYVDWVLPGVLGMNMMFSCLFGVGYMIVRYRTSGVLKRFQATPVTAFQFLFAQILSRLVITLAITVAIFMACLLLLDITVKGSLWAMLVVAIFGALSMIALGLIASVRTNSLELSNGILNIFTWPMLLMSSVWFSFDDAPDWLRWLAECLPLTHLLRAERAIMLDGETLLQQWDALLVMGMTAALFLLISSAMFRWGDE